MNKNLSEGEVNNFLRCSKKLLEGLGLNVYFTGARFKHQGAARVGESEEQIGLLKEADIKIQNRDYTADECKYIKGQIISHIMSFSKNDIGSIASRYDEVLGRIK